MEGQRQFGSREIPGEKFREFFLQFQVQAGIFVSFQ
jgi:hypothetical protein